MFELTKVELSMKGCYIERALKQFQHTTHKNTIMTQQNMYHLHTVRKYNMVQRIYHQNCFHYKRITYGKSIGNSFMMENL